MHRFAGIAAFIVIFLALVACVGCSGSSSRGDDQQALAESAMQAALDGYKQEFISLVAPSFLGEARREMPDIEDESLGGILIAGFLESLPFAGIKSASYETEVLGEKAVVHVWGLFTDERGGEMSIPEAQAVRIPLIKENGQWYLDLLDL
jgi:hypothetical protein